jgi:hypothetical protein
MSPNIVISIALKRVAGASATSERFKVSCSLALATPPRKLLHRLVAVTSGPSCRGPDPLYSWSKGGPCCISSSAAKLQQRRFRHESTRRDAQGR